MSSFDWAGIASAVGQGAAHGLAVNKQETKEKEQQQYDRGREAVADQQKAELHGQTVKQNDFTLQNIAREQAEANRKQLLSQRLGDYQKYKTTGDIDQAAKTYVDFANQDNIGNANFDQNHALSYVKNDDGTVNINIVDKNTGALVRVAKEKATADDFIAATYQQLDPTKSYETQVDNAAKAAQKQQEYNWEERKMGLQYGYDLGKENNKYGHDIGLEGYKFGNSLQMEGYKHGNALELEGIRQAGSNYRTGLTQDGLNARAANGNGTGSTKGSNAVLSGVQGAIGFAQQNAPMLSFLSNNPNLYNKTIAMMGIESAGNPNAVSYDGSSHGPMQINAKYAQGFANQFGIQGNPLTSVQANIQTGAALVNHLDKKYGGDTTLIAAAYNAGEPAIDNALASWKKSGRQGSWFDHLNLNQESRQQVYGHIVKYNQALGYLDGNAQPTNMTIEQQNQNNAKQTTKATDNYRKNFSATTAAAVKNTATAMGTELGLDKGANAAMIGSLAGAQTEITKFANGNSRAARTAAYQNILTMVTNAVKSTDAGLAMSPAQRNEYVHQKSAELVGATNKAEAGIWISRGRFPAATAKPKQQSNLKSNEIDNIFGEVNVGSVQKQAPVAKSGNAFIPMRNAAAPAVPKVQTLASRPKTQMDKNMDDRTARKKAQMDATVKRIKAEEAAKKAKSNTTQRPPMTTQQAQSLFGTSAVQQAEKLKRQLQQNKS